MNIQELKEFRAKLKHAKKLCAVSGFDWKILVSFVDAGLRDQCAGVSFNCMPIDVWYWYVHPSCTPAEREAMWNNSISAIDARIAKEKP